MFLALILLAGQTCSSDQIIQTMQGISRTAKGRVGVAAIVLESGKSVGFHSQEKFSLQSVDKLPIAMAALHAIDQKELDPEQQVQIDRKSLLPRPYHSPLRDQFREGQSFSVMDLLRRMIVESDGTASDTVMRLLGGPEAVNSYLRYLGITDLAIGAYEHQMDVMERERSRNSASPSAIVELLRHIYGSSDLSPRSRSALLMWMAATQTSNRRIKGLVPKETEVFHKTGTSGTQHGFTPATNDVGLITLHGGDHLALAVFVSDSRASEPIREKVIARITRTLWNCW